MGALVRQRPFVNIAEFDAFLETVGDDANLYDLLDGEIVMMTNPSNRHETIVFNIVARLSPAMKQRGCRVHFGNTRVQAGDDTSETAKTRPDILVRCGETTRQDAARNYVTDPIVVVEVLSPSTECVDIFKKAPFHMSLETTRHVVLIHQDERRVDHWHRHDADAEWVRTASPREVLALAAVGFQMTLDEIYDSVPLGAL